jgi:hypothetical protein
MARKSVGRPPTAPTGWAKRLPMPVEVIAGKHKKVLRTLRDVRGYMLEDLPEDVSHNKLWQGVATALIDAAEGDAQTARVEIALRLARTMTSRTRQ